jgi:peptide/nickel transport system substrate-binding protein/oligopeptide transport system substrate-binding protein
MRRPQRAGALLLALTLAATLLAGCAAPWPFPQPTPDPKQPDSQQIFRPEEYGPAGGDLVTMDPALISFQTDYDMAQLLFPGLVTLDGHNQPVDWAAQSHEVSADGLTYTFHLRTGMTWSDGTPIEASTFAYSINRALDPCTGSYNAYYLDVIKGAQAFHAGACPVGALQSPITLIGASLLAPDPLTLQILLGRPAGYFLSALTYPASWAVPQALVERYTRPAVAQPTYPYAAHTTSTWIEHLADNGGFGGNLYRLTRWDHAGHLDLERNERFWGSKPVLRRVDYTLYKTVDAGWTDFTAGSNDVSQVPILDARANPAVEVARTLKGVTLQQTFALSVAFLRINWHAAPFDDVRVREAFSLAIDREIIAHGPYHDMVQPSIHLVPEGIDSYYPALADAAGRIGAAALTADLNTARRLAGAYAAEKCGGDYSACPPITWSFVGAGVTISRATSLLLAQWNAAFPGWRIALFDRCHVQICQIPPIQLSSSGWLADYPDPQQFISSSWTTHSPYNTTELFTFDSRLSAPDVTLPQVDALCAQADAMQDQASRVPLYQQAEQLLITQGAAIPLYQNKATYAVRSHVVGWRVAPIGLTPLSVWQQVYIRR